MERIGFELGRLTTATPARLAAGSIDWTDLQLQHGEDPAMPFCHMNDTIDNDIIDKQVHMHAYSTYGCIRTGVTPRPLRTFVSFCLTWHWKT